MTRLYDSHSLTSAVSITTPAVRLMVVNAWSAELPDGTNETGHQLIPVVALSARVASVFSRNHKPDDHRRPSTIASAEREGWGHEDTGATYDALIVDEESGRIGPADELLFAVNAAHAFVPCPWSPEEDEVRLAGVIARVEREAVANVERRRSKAVA